MSLIKKLFGRKNQIENHNDGLVESLLLEETAVTLDRIKKLLIEQNEILHHVHASSLAILDKLLRQKLTDDKILEGILKDIQGDLGRIADNTKKIYDLNLN